MGIFDLFKKKSGPDASPAPEDGRVLPGERDAGSGDKAFGESPADPGGETPDRRETPGDTIFVPGEAVAPSDDDIPDVGEETVLRIRQLCADRVPLLRDPGRHAAMLDSLKEAYPAVGSFLPRSPLREDMPKEEFGKALGGILGAVAGALVAAAYRPAAAHFNDVETDDLKNAWILLDYYAAVTAKSDPTPFVRGRRMLDKTLWGRLEREDIPLLKRTQAGGKTPDGIAYILREAEENWNYFIELHDPEGRLPQVGKPAEGQIAVLSFALTKDEFALKDEVLDSGSRPKVDALVARLLEKLPGDRIITAGIADKATRKLTPVRIRPGCLTMDDRKLIRWRSRLGTERYSGLERIWVLCSAATGPRFPLLDLNFNALAYSSREYAEAAVKANPAFSLTVREMSAAQFRDYVSSFAPIGVTSFRLNTGKGSLPAEILCDDWLNAPSSSPAYEGAALNRLTLRFRQNLQAKDDLAARAAASTCWNMAAHVLPGTLFLVPFNYREDENVEDHTLHLTVPSANLLKIRSLEHSLGRRLKPDEVKELASAAPAALNIYDRGMFFGGEDYAPADSVRAIPGRLMLFSTVKGGGVTYLCGFTDISSLRAVFPAGRRVAVLTWPELTRFVGTENSDGSVSSGLVINPGYAELALTAAQIEELNKAAKEPLKVFIPQRQKDAPGSDGASRPE